MAKGEQQELPGVEKRIPTIHEKGLKLAAVRSQRMELTKQESELGKEIMQSMKAEGLTIYKVEGLNLEIVAVKERVKVSLDVEVADDDDEGGSGEGDDNEE